MSELVGYMYSRNQYNEILQDCELYNSRQNPQVDNLLDRSHINLAIYSSDLDGFSAARQCVH